LALKKDEEEEEKEKGKLQLLVHTVRGICCLRPLIVSVRPMHWPCLTDELKVRQSMLDK